jgi:hypothetical protein
VRDFISLFIQGSLCLELFIIFLSKSILDLFFTSNSSLINKVEVIPGISDHEIVYVEASIKPRKVNKPPRKVYQYNKAITEELNERLRSIDIEKQLKEQDLTVDQLWNNFKYFSWFDTCFNILNFMVRYTGYNFYFVDK